MKNMLDLSVLNTLSKEELIEKIKSLQKEVVTLSNNKKYGLVWEVKDTDKEELYLNKYPYLKNMGKDIVSNPNDINHILIQGENLQALKILKTTHLGKVDVIYIDPPYNTGNTDFKYKDKFIDSEDGYRHSKWLDFMYKRLNIAKDLLNENGVVFISIDDNEVYQLKLLCDEVFQEQNFIANLIWKKKQGGGNDSRNVIIEHEYILVYAKNEKKLQFNLDEEYELSDIYKDKDENGYYGLVTLDKSSIKYSDSLVFDIKDKDGNIYSPRIIKGKQSCWRWSQKKVREEYDKLVFKGGKVYTKFYKPTGVISKSLLVDERFGRTASGKIELMKIVEQASFTYPKPKQLLKYLLKISSKPNSIILDFFAGSGTTGHAVLELNKEDGGNRQFIICTNNEVDEKLHKELVKKGIIIYSEEYEKHGICQSVTYPRIEKVIKGYDILKNKQVEGLGGNLKYYKIENVDVDDKDTFDIKQELFNNINEILCVGKGIYNKVSSTEDYTVYQENGQTMIIANENFLEHLDTIQEIFDKQEGKKIFYYCSLSGIKGIYLTMDIEQNPIPEELMEKYKIINDNLKNNY